MDRSDGHERRWHGLRGDIAGGEGDETCSGDGYKYREGSGADSGGGGKLAGEASGTGGSASVSGTEG